jgi:hypothetical protein
VILLVRLFPQPPHTVTRGLVAIAIRRLAGGIAMLLGVLALPASRCEAVDRITFERDRTSRTVAGEVVLKAADGGILLQADDGQLWVIQPNEVKDQAHDETPLIPLSADAVGLRLLDELPEGFQIRRTPHYVICHNGSEQYAKWVGTLFEQLHKTFFNFWKKNGWELESPKYPLVAIVFDDEESFLRYAVPEAGDRATNIIGYYQVLSNRIATYNVDDNERRVATLVHEATHQLNYNAGIQTRLVDNPFWVSEGLATFFEVPDFSSEKGWRGAGKVNLVSLNNLQQYLPVRPEDSLLSLLRDDKRFLRAEDAPAAYGEAWALNHYLLKSRTKDYIAYLKKLRDTPQMRGSDEIARIDLVTESLGDLEKLDRGFLKYVRKLKP